MLYSIESCSRDDLIKTDEDIDIPKVRAHSIQLVRKGLCMSYNHFDNQIELTDEVDITDDHVKIIYVRQGIPELNFSNIYQKKPKSGFLTLAYESSCTKMAIHPAHTITDVYQIYIQIDYYRQLMAKEDWRVHHQFYQLFKQGQSKNYDFNYYSVNLKIQSIIEDMIHVEEQLPGCQYLIDLKLRELLFHVYTMECQQINPDPSITANKRNMPKIKAVKDYLDKHLHETPTIKELAKFSSLNELQLKRGFKEMYGSTIRSYMIDMKMKKALRLLEHYNSSETASRLGYQSVSHFISTFKKHYGHPPSHFVSSMRL